jgi:hypothetical protein
VNIKKLSPREREDALNEIRIMASIKHNNIVRYCDAFVERDSLYIVMEFAEHGDISRQVDKFKKANKYIKEETIWCYLLQMLLGMSSMHSRNVLHRVRAPLCGGPLLPAHRRARAGTNATVKEPPSRSPDSLAHSTGTKHASTRTIAPRLPSSLRTSSPRMCS